MENNKDHVPTTDLIIIRSFFFVKIRKDILYPACKTDHAKMLTTGAFNHVGPSRFKGSSVRYTQYLCEMAVGSNVVSKEMANVIEIREIIRFDSCGAKRRAVLSDT